MYLFGCDQVCIVWEICMTGSCCGFSRASVLLTLNDLDLTYFPQRYIFNFKALLVQIINSVYWLYLLQVWLSLECRYVWLLMGYVRAIISHHIHTLLSLYKQFLVLSFKTISKQSSLSSLVVFSLAKQNIDCNEALLWNYTSLFVAKTKKDLKAMEYMKARYEVKQEAAQPKVARQPKKLEHTWGK